MESNTFQQISSKAQTTVPIKQEPTFAVGRQSGSRGRQAKRGGYQQKRDSGVSKRSKSDECRNCGQKPWSREHKEVCPAKGKECSLCKRTGHFARMCRAAKPKVGSIGTKEADYTEQQPSPQTEQQAKPARNAFIPPSGFGSAPSAPDEPTDMQFLGKFDSFLRL